MGSAISSATNAISDAARDVSGAARDTYRQTVGDNIRREVGGVTRAVNRVGRRIGERPLENALSLATLGVPAVLREGGSMAADALGMGEEPIPTPATSLVDGAPVVADPQQKRKRQLAGRAGTLLTGGGAGGGGSTLGGAGGRSTLLGM